MCWVCEHPESTREDRLQYVRGLLDQHCWIVVGVHEERYRPTYSYTVGLSDHGLPELVITGLPKQRAADLLTRAASNVLNGAALAPGKRIRAADGMAVEVVQVAEPGAHMDVAGELYGRQLVALQLVYADRRGRWPWDGRFRGGRGGQPVLGVRGKQAA
jgi:hypothetical protein